MRKCKADCLDCGWRGIGATRQGVSAMAIEHQNAVQGHRVRLWVPEGMFGWATSDMYWFPPISEKERARRERLAAGWNIPYRYNGD